MGDFVDWIRIVFLCLLIPGSAASDPGDREEKHYASLDLNEVSLAVREEFQRCKVFRNLVERQASKNGNYMGYTEIHPSRHINCVEDFHLNTVYAGILYGWKMYWNLSPALRADLCHATGAITFEFPVQYMPDSEELENNKLARRCFNTPPKQ